MPSRSLDSTVLPKAVRLIDRFRRRSPARSKDGQKDRLHLLLEECRGLLRCKRGSVWIVDIPDGEIRCFHGLDGEEVMLDGFRLKPGEGVTGACVRSLAPMVVNDVREHGIHSRRADQVIGSSTVQIVSCPLICRGVALGAMNILNRTTRVDDKFSDEEVLAAQLFAGAIADHLVQDKAMWSAALKMSKSGRHGPFPSQTELARESTDTFASSQMEDVAFRIRSSESRPLLLTGETGVGKDHLARWAHEVSPVSRGPFIVVDCPGIPHELWESEVFGHVRGAFTGASDNKQGQVELAAGGTLFLNEIGELPVETQVKLLRFLDSGEYQRVGDTRTRSVSTRIVAATNRDLHLEMRQDRFRKDLYYRLADMHIVIPPLRERTPDIVALSAVRLQYLSERYDVDPPWVSLEAREFLVAQEWEGNVRELFSTVETAFHQCRRSGDDVLRLDHFGTKDQSGKGGLSDPTTNSGKTDDAGYSDSASGLARLAGHEGRDDRSIIAQALDRTRCVSSGRWNLSAAYRLLDGAGRVDTSLRTFIRRVRRDFEMDAQRASDDRFK